MAPEIEKILTLPDAALEVKPESSTQAALHGSVLVLIQFDVCEEIRLDQLRELLDARTLEQPTFKHPTPGYVRYQRPPVVEPVEPLVLDSGERLQAQEPPAATAEVIQRCAAHRAEPHYDDVELSSHALFSFFGCQD